MRLKGTEGCPPLEIDGTGLRGGKIELAADVSSQFVSSILLSAPYLSLFSSLLPFCPIKFEKDQIILNLIMTTLNTFATLLLFSHPTSPYSPLFLL
jgi:ABC-type uncharacterized transport system permease subunit